MGEVTSALLNSMSNQFCVECRTLSPVEVTAFISHITHTYGHFRPNYASLPLRSESAIRDEVP